MKRILMLTTVFAATFSAGLAHAATYLTVSATDYNGFTSLDGAAYVSRPASQKSVGYIGQTATGVHTTTYMSAAEYDISALPQNAIILTAALYTPFTNFAFIPSLPVFGTEYVGDGSVTADDLTTTGSSFNVTAKATDGQVKVDANSLYSRL